MDEIPIISEKQLSFAIFLSHSFSLFSPFIFVRKEHFRELAEAATGFVGRWKQLNVLLVGIYPQMIPLG